MDDFARALLQELADLVEPIESALASDAQWARLLDDLGWQEPLLPERDGLRAALDASGAGVRTVGQLASAPPPERLRLEVVLAAARSTFDAVRALGKAGGATAGLEQLGVELAWLLLLLHLRQNRPAVIDAAILLGLVQAQEESAPTAEVKTPAGLVVRRAVRLSALRLDALQSLLENPARHLRALYPMGSAEQTAATSDKLLPRLGRLLRDFGFDVVYGKKPEYGLSFGEWGDKLAARMLTASRVVWARGSLKSELGAALALSAEDYGGLGLVVVPTISAAFSEALGAWQVDAALTAGIQAFAVGSGGVTILSPDPAALSATLSLGAARLQTADEPPIEIGSGAATLRVGGASARLDAALAAQASALGLSLEVHDAALHLEAPDDDGLLAALLPGGGLDASFALALDFSTRDGLRFRGAASLEAPLSANASSAGVAVSQVQLALRGTGAGAALELSAALDLALGPLALELDRLGFAVRLSWPAGGGNLGPLELSVEALAPTGALVAFDAGAFAGGGYVAHDAQSGRYSGALALRALDFTLDAFGLLDTRLPSGAAGYSFVALIAADLPPIQLGFGFTLDGVGGLVGIERTMSVAAIQAAVRSHAIEDVLFPRDPAKDAARIVATLGALFPPAHGHFVFGPMVRVGWGTPRVVDAQLAVLLELPGPRVALAGELNAAFPARGSGLAIIDLHMDVAGVLDFPGKSLALDASLRDSRIAGYIVSGEMALRLSWGDRPSFALSVGGLHPHYPPPPGFPNLQRFTVALCTGNPRVTLQAYLALTSNSLQLGARAELYASYGVTLYGFVSFDALVTFSPFAFEVDLAGGVALRVGDTNIASVHLSGHLSGPSPWHIHGEAGISILFFDISVSFDVTFGDARKQVLPEADPWSDLKAALASPASYASLAAPGARSVSAPRPPASDAPALFDPAGGARFHQKVTPFDVRLTRYGSGAPKGGAQTFALQGATFAGKPLAIARETDLFAPAQFTDLTAEEKLSGPSFLEWVAGFSATPAPAPGRPSEAVEIDYQSWLVRGNADGSPAELKDPPPTLPPAGDGSAAATGSVARGRRGRGGLGRYFADAELGLERRGGLGAKSLVLVEVP